MIDLISLWFKRAKPQPTPADFNTQVGCHLEELVEMLQTLKGNSADVEDNLRLVETTCHRFAERLKAGTSQVEIANRREFLDALADQIVTATGCGVLSKMNIEEAVARVNTSNWSKFREDGTPIFYDNGKIAKNYDTYRKPDLEGLY